MAGMKKVDDLISIIMPAYNSERFIPDAIRSVIAQTYTNWELIVIDDGSTDLTVNIVRAFEKEDPRIRLIVNDENIGAARTRNRGFDLCQGDFVALLDSDDLWKPEKLSLQRELLLKENADLCYTSYAIIDDSGIGAKKDYTVPESVSFDSLLKENVIGCSTVLLTRSVIEKHRFVTDYYHEDYVLWLDLLKSGHRAVGITKTLTSWRYLRGSRSFDKQKSAKNRWNIYRKHLKIPLFKSVLIFSSYAFRGFIKYFR